MGSRRSSRRLAAGTAADGTTIDWDSAFADARAFLRRWGDGFTRREGEELAQEAVCTAWRCAGFVRDRARFPAFVRTIARRVRSRALAALTQRAAQVEHLSPAGDGAVDAIAIGDVVVERAWLLAQLDAALARMSQLDRTLLLAYHEGFCCEELANRFSIPATSVKTRLHRGRRRLRRELERVVRAAGHREHD